MFCLIVTDYLLRCFHTCHSSFSRHESKSLTVKRKKNYSNIENNGGARMNFSTLRGLSVIHETSEKTVPPNPASPPARVSMPEGGKPASSRICTRRNCHCRHRRFVSSWAGDRCRTGRGVI